MIKRPTGPDDEMVTTSQLWDEIEELTNTLMFVREANASYREEVERLRAATSGSYFEELNKARAEVERLRAQKTELGDVVSKDLMDEVVRLRAEAEWKEEVIGALKDQRQAAWDASIRRGAEISRLQDENEELEYRSWCLDPGHVTHRGPYH